MLCGHVVHVCFLTSFKVSTDVTFYYDDAVEFEAMLPAALARKDSGCLALK